MIILSILTNSKVIKYIYIPAALVLLCLYGANSIIINSTKDLCFNSTEKIPARKVGLLLGTNKSAKGGRNLFFQYRIDAAVALFKAGKIKHIIVSGDNHIKEYNEAEDMQLALIEAGVPDSCITLDYAGFRTLDSVVRCKEVFGQDKITIISQHFHNERALFIAMKNEMDCVAFDAKDVPVNYSLKTKVREYFARVKCLLDVYILHTSPKFLGEKVTINI